MKLSTFFNIEDAINLYECRQTWTKARVSFCKLRREPSSIYGGGEETMNLLMTAYRQLSQLISVGCVYLRDRYEGEETMHLSLTAYFQDIIA